MSCRAAMGDFRRQVSPGFEHSEPNTRMSSKVSSDRFQKLGGLISETTRPSLAALDALDTGFETALLLDQRKPSKAAERQQPTAISRLSSKGAVPLLPAPHSPAACNASAHSGSRPGTSSAASRSGLPSNAQTPLVSPASSGARRAASDFPSSSSGKGAPDTTANGSTVECKSSQIVHVSAPEKAPAQCPEAAAKGSRLPATSSELADMSVSAPAAEEERDVIEELAELGITAPLSPAPVAKSPVPVAKEEVNVSRPCRRERQRSKSVDSDRTGEFNLHSNGGEWIVQ
mmetsp:Transcript_36493/g.66478  ORF Transcript_36493/g.66478 Transcript_36493/m.66478 type:complete len:288 (+) Transcript_36493:102-965(+)